MATNSGNFKVKNGIELNGSIIFEGSTNNTFETTLTVIDPTSDRTISLPNQGGTLLTDANPISINNGGTGGLSRGEGLANLFGYQTTQTSGITTTLNNQFSYYQFFTGTLSQTVVLPVTSTIYQGWTFKIINNSTGTLTINSSGGNLVITVPSGTSALLTCIGISLTTAADWEASLTGFSTYTGTGNLVLSNTPTFSGTVTIPTLNLTNALGYQYGGTGLTTLGTAGQVLTVNSGATAAEWKDATGGGSGVASYQTSPPSSPVTGQIWVDSDFDLADTTNIVTLLGTETLENKTIVSPTITGTGTIAATSVTLSGDLAVNGGDITTTATTAALFDTNVTTLNIGGVATTVNIGAATGTTNILNGLAVTGSAAFNGGFAVDSTAFSVADTTGNTLIAGTLGVTGLTTLTGDIAVNGGDITTTSTTATLFNTTATTLNIGGATTGTTTATGLVLGSTATGATSWTNISTAALTGAFTKNINIGTGGTTGSTTTIGIGSTVGSTTTINGTVQLTSGSTKIGNTSIIQGGTVNITLPTLAGTLIGTGDSGTVSNTMLATVGIAKGGTGATTANAAMANLMGYTSTATAAGTTTLTNASSYYQQFTGSLTQTVVLPVTSTLTTGWTFHIVNNSTSNLTVNSSGGNLVITVIPGTTAMATCIGTALTTAADWESGITDFSTITGTGSVVLSVSPTFTGTPLSTTAAADTNTTQIATTAFVVGQASSATPLVNGTATVGTSLRYAREGHIHPTDTTRAPLASPAFTGTPTVGGLTIRSAVGGVGAATTSGATLSVTHGLGTTPISVVASVRANTYNSTPRSISVGNFTATTFTIFATDSAGGAATPAFSWIAIQ